MGSAYYVDMNTTHTANAVSSAIAVLSLETLPDGVQVVTVPCADFAALEALPQAIELEGQHYGRTGWNSDRFVAYFRSDKAVATAV